MIGIQRAIADLSDASEADQLDAERHRARRLRWFEGLPPVSEQHGTTAQQALLRGRRADIERRLEAVAFLDLACDRCGGRLIDEHPRRNCAVKPPTFMVLCLGCGWSASVPVELRSYTSALTSECA